MDILYNRVSDPLYLMLHYVGKSLKERGYTLIQSSTHPVPDADKTVYIECPDPRNPSNQIDPEKITKAERASYADLLFEVTNQRTHGQLDTYNWENPMTITRFEEMIPVSVQVPKGVHEYFLEQTATILSSQKNNITRVPNTYKADEQARIQSFQDFFQSIYRMQ